MNVVVIVTDSLRADHLGCYGNPWIKTPNLDRFSREATLFEEAYSEGLPTMPTRTAWWTGRYTFPFRAWQPMEKDDVLLAEVLWDKGYTSAFFTDVYHMHKPSFNCGRGFDCVQFIRGQEYDPLVVDPNVPVDLSLRHRLRGDESDKVWKPRFEQYLRNLSLWPDWWESDENHFVAQTIKAAMRWLEALKKRDRVFLWVDCFDPHEPWDPPKPFDLYSPRYKGADLIDPVPGPVKGHITKAELNRTKALYAGEVTLVDKWVGVLLDWLRDHGWFDNSLVMHTSDHGEPFGEHGIVRKAMPWPYDEQVRIPWLMRHPSGLGRGKRVKAFVETCDLMPTVLEFLGVKGPVDKMHGQSLLPLAAGKEEKVRDYAYCGWHKASWNIRSRDWSYIHWLPGARHGKTENELYSRRKDPGEQKNVLDQHRDVADELELELRRFVAALK